LLLISRSDDAGMMRRPEVGGPPIIEASKINFFSGIFFALQPVLRRAHCAVSKKTDAVVT
jgi:hypothetical protein